MLKTAAGLLVAGSIACVVVAVAMPLTVVVPTETEPRRTVRAAIDAGLLPLDQYDVIYAKDVRRPLYDPPPVVVPPPAAPPPPPLTLQLMGTVLEPGFEYAIVRTGAGQEKLMTVGETLDGAELLRLDVTTATVRFVQQERTLKVQKKESP
jgi:hypothetical protein